MMEGYQKKPCLDPLDKECPKTAPNYLNICPLVEHFVAWNKDQSNRFHLERKNVTTSYDYSDYYDTEKSKETKSEICKQYEDSVRNLLRSRKELIDECGAPETIKPKRPNLNDITSLGCPGLMSNVLKWP